MAYHQHGLARVAQALARALQKYRRPWRLIPSRPLPTTLMWWAREVCLSALILVAANTAQSTGRVVFTTHPQMTGRNGEARAAKVRKPV